jgi:multiple sugar transport system substrate-binding protein
VDVTTLEYEDVPARLIEALGSGSGAPDVSWIDDQYLGSVLARGGLLDLSEAPYDGRRYEGDFIRSAWGLGVSENRLLSIPWATYPVSMWYREDILRALGLDTDPRRLEEKIDTWEDFLQLGLDLKRRGDNWLMRSSYDDIFRPAVAQRGFGWVDGRKLLLEEKLTGPLALAARASGLGLDAAPDIYNSAEQIDLAMEEGRVAAVAGTGWEQKHIAEAYPRTVGRWRAARPPGGYLVFGGTYLVVPERGEKQSAAWEFVRFVCCTPEGQNASFVATGGLPAYKPAWRDPMYDQAVGFFGGQRVYRVWTEAAEGAPVGVLSLLKPGNLDDIVLPEIDSALRGDKDPRRAMRDAEAAALKAIPGLTR